MNKLKRFKTVRNLMVVVSLVLSMMMAGCGMQSYTPVVMNTGNISQAQYQNDLQECRNYAEQRPDALTASAEGGAISGAAGAVVGGVLGSFDGKFGQGSAAGAIIGGLLGGIKSGIAAHNKQKLIVLRCMKNKGYALLAD